MTYQIAVAARMLVGGGALDRLPELVSGLGAERPVVVTDGFLQSTGLAERVRSLLEEAGLDVAVFSGTVPDPTTDSLQPGLDLVAAHRADLLVGLGGGSPIDTAKALAVLSVRGGSLAEIKAPASYDGPALPVVAVPTTAGTGSEATRFTVVTDSGTGEKMLCAGDSYLPAAAVVDHELTRSMPARLTADTGIDALTHAVEAYVSRRATAFSDGMARQAVRMIGANLRRVWVDGEDVEARAAMMEAATFAGIAFSNASVALVHAMSRPLGARFRIAHGMSNAMLFPEVTAWSLESALPRYAECARLLGVAREGEGDQEAAAALVQELRSLQVELEVPTPAAFGITAEDWEQAVPLMAEQAVASGSHANNPRVPDAEEIERLYRTVYAAR